MADALAKTGQRITELEGQVQRMTDATDENSVRERLLLQEQLAQLRAKEVLLIKHQGMHVFVH